MEANLFSGRRRDHIPKSFSISPHQRPPRCTHILRVIPYLAAAICTGPVAAQIIPDATLPANSAVTQNGNTITINGGTQAGGNLFHSFQEFSVTEGNTALFNNALDIQNILTRVTGGNISSIQGTIKTSGGANLFLLNPKGIIFGPNARLDIGGSFVATTADSLQFPDGIVYSATNPTESPLLTINLPVGLQFGANPGNIVNQSQAAATASPAAAAPVTGLQVSPNHTLALLGGDVSAPGGHITVAGGAIEIAGIGGGNTVGISPSATGYSFAYGDVTPGGSVLLSDFALIDGTGDPSSAINIQAGEVQILSGARVYAHNTGAEAGFPISIAATTSFQLVGNGTYGPNIITISDTDFRDPNPLPTGLYAVTSGSGAGGSLTINTPQFDARNSAFVESATSGAGPGGDITINATESANISASSMEARTTIGSTGDGGNLTLTTGRLTVSNVGILGISTNGAGKGGNLTINASESVEVVGTNLLFAGLRADGLPVVLNTALFAATAGDGDAGELRLFTQRLTVRDGAAIVPNSTSGGRPGNATIIATESVTFAGQSPPGRFRNSSGILASAGNRAAPGGGNIRIITDEFTLRDLATISARRASPGTGGSIAIDARSILLDEGTMVAETAFGQGGNITLNARDIQLRNGSTISATAGIVFGTNLELSEDVAAFFAAGQVGEGDGGNITITTENLTALENSDIIANSQEGFGGKVSITAEGIFGTQFRDGQTSESDITASSALGAEFSGVVEINTPDVDPSSGLVELTAGLVDPGNQLAASCAADRGSSFTVTGRGGLPEDPTTGLMGRALWWDSRPQEGLGGSANGETGVRGTGAVTLPASPIIEATGLLVNSKGELELVAQLPPNHPWYRQPQCADNRKELYMIKLE